MQETCLKDDPARISDMKRIRELIADVKTQYEDGFFDNFERSCQSEDKATHYRSYNGALMTLDPESWSILKAKTLKQFKNERQGQRKEAFFNHLNEAFAYQYLSRWFDRVRFLKESGKTKCPDICFVNGGVDWFCEVKTLGISDREIGRRESHSAYSLDDYRVLDAGFLGKLTSSVREAWKQIHAAGKNGLVFVFIRPDDISWDHYLSHRKQLTEFSRRQGFKNLIIKFGELGNRRLLDLAQSLR